jgi:hypothetical protein
MARFDLGAFRLFLLFLAMLSRQSSVFQSGNVKQLRQLLLNGC